MNTIAFNIGGKCFSCKKWHDIITKVKVYMTMQIISYESRKYGSFWKKINEFLWNTENVATILYTYIICHIKYIYDLGKDHKIESLMFYNWNWKGMCMIS